MGNSSLNFFIRFRSIAAFLLIFFACALDTLALQAGELIFPASSHIGLVPPNNMVVSPDFAGFVDRETSTSILITAMPKDAFDEVAAGMTAERLATQGMKLLGPCNNVEPRLRKPLLPGHAGGERLLVSEMAAPRPHGN